MPQPPNIIDLTDIPSDEESKDRDYRGTRPQKRYPPLSSRIRPAPYDNNNGHPSAGSAFPGPSSYPPPPQRRLPWQHAGEDRRLQAPAPAQYPSFGTTYPDNLGSEKPHLQGWKPVMRGPMKPKSQKRACVNCVDIDATCDGEQPCGACVEPGLPCEYPGDERPINKRAEKGPISSTKRRPLPSLVPHRVDGRNTASNNPIILHNSTSAISVDMIKQTDLLPNRLLEVGRSGQEDAAAQILAEEPFIDSEESDDDDDVPLAIAEFEDVKKLLQKHETRMREHRAYLLQPLLNQAKLDARNAPGPDLPSQISNPFKSLLARTKPANSVSHNKVGSIQIQMKSHKQGAPKKWNQTSVQMKVIDTGPTILPKYKSIGRLGNSLLAPNIRTLKYWPYFPDEEDLDPSDAKKNEELEERYQHDDNHLLAQRKCSGLVDMWRPWVKDFVSKLRIEFRDILYWFLHTTERTSCDTCEREVLADAFSEVARLLPKPPDRSLKLAQLSTMALKDVAKISMWHFVLGAPSVKDLMKQIEPSKGSTSILCSVCFLHNCLSHGAYLEPEESGGAVIMGGNVEINDEEQNHNVPLSAAVPNRDYVSEHQCGLYCVAPEARVKDILGRRKDGVIGGIHNHLVHVPRLTFDNDTTCSDNCYWLVEKRTRFGTMSQTKGYQPKLSEESKDLFKLLLRLYSDNQRVPCMLAKDIAGLECINAFYYMLAEIQRVSHFHQVGTNATQQGTRKTSRIAAGLDTTLSADLDERPPFIPCSHAGSCLNNPDCTCVQSKVHCEWFCGCDKSCERRFPGCKCSNAGKTCFSDKNCECWKHNRECDPWLCGTCGVVEVLDPQNKYDEKIRRGRCRNNRIQLELPARTIKAPSEVQGWGLYAGVDLEEQAFIGEYKGETVGNQESDRRGAVYANIGQEYLFVMNRDQQIDGSNFGNKTRFINNSQRDDYINVLAKKLLCNGVQRVMLYAKRPIKAGEELLYNYNYPISVTKKFWERGEGPTNVPGAVVAKPSITWAQTRVNGRFAKVAAKQDGEQSSMTRTAQRGEASLSVDEEHTSRQDTKRKRISEIGLPTPHASAGGTAVVRTGGLGPKDLTERSGVHFPDDPEDSDFELWEQSETSESVDEGDEPDQLEGSTTDSRRRIIYSHDRRRGGLAQAKAWETRRKRNGKGK